jgi:hypothetical protein
MQTLDSAFLFQLFIALVTAPLGALVYAWALRKALGEWAPGNPLDSWPRALTVGGLNALVGIVMHVAGLLAVPVFIALNVGRFVLWVWFLARVYRVGMGFALGVSLTLGLFVTVLVGATTMALFAAAAVSPFLAVFVALAGAAGLGLHLLSGWRLQSRFDAVE